MDRVLINDLLCRCIIGVNEDERREKQDVIINIAVSADLRIPGKSDRFEDTLDYRDLKKKVLSMVENSRFSLIEALAEAVAGICLEFPLARKVHVRVEKPAALRFARSAAVEITRERQV